jgi:hypothetical protein
MPVIGPSAVYVKLTAKVNAIEKLKVLDFTLPLFNTPMFCSYPSQPLFVFFFSLQPSVGHGLSHLRGF